MVAHPEMLVHHNRTVHCVFVVTQRHSETLVQLQSGFSFVVYRETLFVLGDGLPVKIKMFEDGGLVPSALSEQFLEEVLPLPGELWQVVLLQLDSPFQGEPSALSVDPLQLVMSVVLRRQGLHRMRHSCT